MTVHCMFIDDLFDGDINTGIFTYFLCSLTMYVSFVCIACVLVKDLRWLEEKNSLIREARYVILYIGKYRNCFHFAMLYTFWKILNKIIIVTLMHTICSVLLMREKRKMASVQV